MTRWRDFVSVGGDEAVTVLAELGCHHEMRHEELMMTDLLNALSYDPLLPGYRGPEPTPVASKLRLAFIAHEDGLRDIGHTGDGFAYDCEQPRHRAFLAPFEIVTRPVTNRDWIAFIEAGGYGAPTLWLSYGWASA